MVTVGGIVKGMKGSQWWRATRGPTNLIILESGMAVKLSEMGKGVVQSGRLCEVERLRRGTFRRRKQAKQD